MDKESKLHTFYDLSKEVASSRKELPWEILSRVDSLFSDSYRYGTRPHIDESVYFPRELSEGIFQSLMQQGDEINESGVNVLEYIDVQVSKPYQVYEDIPGEEVETRLAQVKLHESITNRVPEATAVVLNSRAEDGAIGVGAGNIALIWYSDQLYKLESSEESDDIALQPIEDDAVLEEFLAEVKKGADSLEQQSQPNDIDAGLFEKPLRDLSLSIPTDNILSRQGIGTIGALVDCYEDRLRAEVRGFGHTRLQEVKGALGRIGQQLRQRD